MRLSAIGEVVLGLAVVAALAATAVSVRSRQALPDGASGSSPADVPDVTRADATAEFGDLRVRIAASPRPLLALAPRRYRFRVEANGTQLAVTAAVLSFEMTMPMGEHRHALAPAADGWQEAVAALPSCPRGGRRWFGRLDFRHAGRARSARFRLDLEPATASAGASRAR